MGRELDGHETRSDDDEDAVVLSIDSALVESIAHRRFKAGLRELWNDLGELDSVSGGPPARPNAAEALLGFPPPCGGRFPRPVPSPVPPIRPDEAADAPLAEVVDLAAYRAQRAG